jgi:D-alanyl-D-alanine endopeptidase (penicillin-binding protein 7)
MHDFRHTSFDTRGFVFAAKVLMVIIVLFAGVRYGTAYAADLIVKKSDDTSVDQNLLTMAQKRAMRSVGEVNLLKKLQEYESTLSTRTIGTASAESLAETHEKFIGADLANMKLYLYEDGYATTTIEILSKGKRGSQWETPTGLYKIETQEIDHFSSLGAVHMPYSMQFFGNFFVHGWPYYSDGTPVPEGYSGGCIRLSTEDAQKVFEFAQKGTPIFVWEGAEEGASVTVAEKSLPRVTSKSFIIANIATGEVYAEKDADTARPIASLSKLLAALVANETIHYDRTLAVTADDRKQTDGTPGSIIGSDSFEVGDLLYPLLMESNNSVAYSLARYMGQENFVGWMNDKARAIGMEETHMADPSGISPENVASATDLFKLARYIAGSQSFILNISRLPQKTIHAEDGSEYVFGNFNHFAGNPQFLGGKTGYTNEAQQTMVAVFEIPVEDETATIAIVVLGASDRKADVEKLLAWFKGAAEAR